jgi:hexosaminidase
MTPGSNCYFDYYQGNPKFEPLAIGGYTPVEKVYSYEPVPPGLSPSEEQYILGAQGNVWTEYIATTQQVEYMALPRMAALSEVVWSPAGSRDWNYFLGRLLPHLRVLDMLKINYSKSLFQLKTTTRPADDGGGVMYELTPPLKDGEIRYTTDGSEPGRKSEEYAEPILVAKSGTVKAGLRSPSSSP